MLVQCWASVADGGPTLNQHWLHGITLTLKALWVIVIQFPGRCLHCLKVTCWNGDKWARARISPVKGLKVYFSCLLWWLSSHEICTDGQKRDIETVVHEIRRCLIGVGLITEVKQRRARLVIRWVTAWDCQVPYALGHRAAMSCRGNQRTT